MGDFIIANDRRDNTHTSQIILTNCLKSNKIIGPLNGSTFIINGDSVVINSDSSICLNASDEICLNADKIIINGSVCINGSLIITPQLKHGVQVDQPSSGVHGVVGNIVGTSDSQALTNKNLSSLTNTFETIISSGNYPITGANGANPASMPYVLSAIGNWRRLQWDEINITFSLVQGLFANGLVPIGSRPPHELSFPVWAINNSINVIGNVIVLTNGNVQFFQGYTSSFTADMIQIHESSITWRV